MASYVPSPVQPLYQLVFQAWIQHEAFQINILLEFLVTCHTVRILSMYQYLVNSLAIAHTGLITNEYPQRRPLGYLGQLPRFLLFSKGNLWTSLLISDYFVVKVLFY